MLSRYIKAAEESSDSFLRSLVSPYSKRSIFTGVIIFLISFTLFASLTPNALINMDAGVYAELIANSELSLMRCHLGYYLLGIMFTFVLRSSSDYTLNLMSCFFGALSISLIFHMGLTLFRKHTAAVISSLFLATNFIFLKNALYAEIYVPQTFFLLLALQFWLLNKPILTGLSFALATLITPTSIFAIPCFIILRPHKRALFRFAAIAFIILAALLLPHWRDYLFGHHGVLRAAELAPIDPAFALLKELREIGSGFLLCIPFVLVGIVQLLRDKALRVFGIAIFALWLFNFLGGERFADVPVQLPTYVLLSLLGGLGFHLFSTILRGPANRVKINHLVVAFGVLILAVSITGFRAYTKIDKKTHDLVQYRDAVAEMSEIADPDYFAVGKKREAVLFMHYAYEKSDMEKWINRLYFKEGWFTAGWFAEHWIYAELLLGDWGGTPQQVDAIKRWQDAIASGREIWILQDSPPLFADLRKGGYTIERFRSVFRASKRQD